MSNVIESYSRLQENKTDVNLQKFYNTLSISTFLIPFKVVNGIENLITIQDRNETVYFPIFTDFAAVSRGVLNTSSEAIKFAEVTIKEIDNVLQKHASVKAVVLNPYDINVVISKEEVQFLYSLNNSAKVIFGIPAEDTKIIESKLSDIFRDMPDINRAYFTKIVIRDESSYLVVIEGIGKLQEEVFQKISKEIVERKLYLKLPLDMISSDTKLGKDIISSQNPFYIKNK